MFYISVHALCGRLCRPQRSLRDADRLRTPGSMSSYMAYMSSCNGDISALNVSILLDDLLRPFKLSLLNSLTDDQWWSEIRWWLKTTTICALCKKKRAQFRKKNFKKRNSGLRTLFPNHNLLRGWLAIAKLKPLSLFISLLLMLKKAIHNIKMEGWKMKVVFA